MYPNYFRKFNDIGLIALFLFVINLSLGLLFINEGLFHFDSVVLARAVESTYQTGHLHPAVCGRYGAVIINAILYFPFYLSGQNADLVTRLSSVLFHSLSIVALFFLICEIFTNRLQAFFGALLFAVIPLYFVPDTYGKEHGMSMFFLLSAFYFLCREGARGDVLLTAISGALYAAAISVRESMLVLAPFYVILFLRPEITWCPFRVIIPRDRIAPGRIAAAAAPFLILTGIMFFSYLREIITRTLLVRDFATASFPGPFSPQLGSVVGDVTQSVSSMFFVCSLSGAILMFRQQKPFWTIFLSFWCLLFFFFANTVTFCMRYLDVVFVPVCIFASYTLVVLEKISRLMARLMFGMLFLGMLLTMYPALEFRHHYNGAKQFALFVKAVTEKDAVIIVADEYQFIEYYGLRATISPPGKGAQGEFENKVRELLKRKVPVYLADSVYVYDLDGTFREWVYQNFRLQKTGQWMSESFYRPENGLRLFYENLYRVEDLKTMGAMRP